MRKAALLLMFGFCSMALSDDNSTKAMIYFIPFQVETYQPITPQNIKDKATYTLEIRSEESLSRIALIFNRNDEMTEKFDAKRVRLLFEHKSKALYVDSYGNVLSNDKQFALSKKDFEDLQDFLSHLIKETKK